MSSNLRYNLRNRASGPRPGAHSGLAPLPDSEHSDAASAASSARSSSVWPGVSYSQAASHHVGADTASLSDQEANPRVSGGDTVPSNGREAHPRSSAPQYGTAELSSLSSSDKENISSSFLSHEMGSSLTTMNVASEEIGNGQWTEVRRRKRRARSLDSATPQDVTPPRVAVVPPAGTTPLNEEQQRAVRAAEKSLNKEERGRIAKRMRAVSNPRGQSSSRGEGPSTMAKGKTVDARNWGAVGIDPAELDPKAQREALAQFSAHKAPDYYNSDEDSEDECEAQDAVLQYYAAIKAAKQQNKPSVRTVTDESDRGLVARQARDRSLAGQFSTRSSSRIEATSNKDLERQIAALRKELAEVQRARSVSEKSLRPHAELLRDGQSTTSGLQAPSRDTGVVSSDAEAA
ncbi:hypothetical protein GSI_12081 [Ganoderma sinense ZZ0214-1]|uniref:Uncharacterized protein n=1 Tax=Ganoderma sinense ZZ0214-1 TaxID=1077348 RepID=A0A2G8RXT6_9APHY|nr:hypothetical protein GSI_12081 [Ganoderma sinense ZZ0214-1]